MQVTTHCFCFYYFLFRNAVKPQWLEHLWDHGNLFETWVDRASEGYSSASCQEANGNNLGKPFWSPIYNGMLLHTHSRELLYEVQLVVFVSCHWALYLTLLQLCLIEMHMTLRDECVCHLKTLFVFFTCYFDRTFVIAFATPYFMLNVYKPTNEQTLKRLNTFYGPRQVKRCLQTCAKCIDSSSFRACAKSQPGISYPLIHSIMSSNSVSGRRRP